MWKWVVRMLLATLALVVALGLSLVLNALWLDEFDTYGEVPIPGAGTVHLPAGKVKVSFHSSNTEGYGGDGGLKELPLPEGFELSIRPPDGVPKPTMTDAVATTDEVPFDGHYRQIRVADVAQAGDYTVTTDGMVSRYDDPRVSFGRGSQFWFVSWILVVLSILSFLATLVVAMVTSARSATTASDETGPSIVRSRVTASELGSEYERAKAKRKAEGPAELEQRRQNWVAIDSLIKEFIPEATRRSTTMEGHLPKHWIVQSTHSRRYSLAIFAKSGDWIVNRVLDGYVYAAATSKQPGSGPLETEVVDGLREGAARLLKYRSKRD